MAGTAATAVEMVVLPVSLSRWSAGAARMRSRPPQQIASGTTVAGVLVEAAVCWRSALPSYLSVRAAVPRAGQLRQGGRRDSGGCCGAGGWWRGGGEGACGHRGRQALVPRSNLGVACGG